MWDEKLHIVRDSHYRVILKGEQPGYIAYLEERNMDFRVVLYPRGYSLIEQSVTTLREIAKRFLIALEEE